MERGRPYDKSSYSRCNLEGMSYRSPQGHRVYLPQNAHRLVFLDLIESRCNGSGLRITLRWVEQ